MPNFGAHLQYILFASVIPLGTGLSVYASWKCLMWAYGGQKQFVTTVFKEPLQKEWFMVNPKNVFFREAPLSNIPEKLPDSIGKYDNADSHPHAKNW